MFGAMVWVFQDGHFAGALDFTATDAIAAPIPILMFCIAFGLSMDYNVFLLSRIREEYDDCGDNSRAIVLGVARSGRILSTAAIVVAVVCLGTAASRVSYIKLFGIGLALAVLLDAFVIRGTMVPALMKLAGRANWWSPGLGRRTARRDTVLDLSSLETGANDAAEVGVEGAQR
jgi:RND superfamily putative drug exporter